MSDSRRRLVMIALAGLVLAACSAGPSASTSASVAAPTTASAPSPTTDAPSAGAIQSGLPPASSAAPVVLTQAWATASLTDVATGETFRIADLAGSVVILETMATWCTNCLAQQRDVQAALAQLPEDRVEFVVLDVDPNEDAASLAEYQAANEFSGRYAVAGKDVARALAAEFGDQFLNPPSTPILIVGSDGTVTATEFGHKGVDELVTLARANGA